MNRYFYAIRYKPTGLFMPEFSKRTRGSTWWHPWIDSCTDYPPRIFNTRISARKALIAYITQPNLNLLGQRIPDCRRKEDFEIVTVKVILQVKET